MADHLDDADRQNVAAVVIQRGWRDYAARRQREAEASGAPTAAATRELSEEERREQLLGQVRALIADREVVINQNLAQQRLLARVLAERRALQPEATLPSPDAAGSMAADSDAKYWDVIKKLREGRSELEVNRERADVEMHESRQKHDSILSEALLCERQLRDFIADTARKAVFLRNSRQIPAKDIDDWVVADTSLQATIHEVRIQYIKLRNRNAKYAAQLKKKEQLNDGLHLIDFEQLKIENTNLNEKIEERNEDLLKLRKKSTTTIHILTHVKEKVEFVKAENVQCHKQVVQQEELLTVLRDRLAHAKKDRDVFVNENLRMKEKMPMIGAEDLLMDYELRKKELEDLRIAIVTQTNKHHELLQWITSHHALLEKLQHTASAAGIKL